MIDSQHQGTSGGEIGPVSHYNPINVSDVLGATMLGILALILLVALLRCQARNRKLLAQLARLDGDQRVTK
jgi:hypothetical protein